MTVQSEFKEFDGVGENEHLVVPSARDMRTILDLLHNPPPPNARLRLALKRHHELFGGTEDVSAD